MASVLHVVAVGIALLASGHGLVMQREVVTSNPSLLLTRNVTLDDRSNCKPGNPQPPNRVDTTERVARLRQEMAKYELDAYIVPTDDDHQNEFVGESDKRRRYISGFSGSAGTAVVLMDRQALWTDGRYFLQADDELDCNWLLMKSYIPGTPTILQWLKQSLPAGARVGADPTLISAGNWVTYLLFLSDAGIKVIAEQTNLVDLIWTDRPPYPTDPAFPLEMKYTGKSWEAKVMEVRDAMKKEGSDTLVVTALDEIAWLLNLRGNDIPFNPVFRSYLIMTMDKIDLFTPPEKISAEVEEHLHINSCAEMLCVTIRNYEEFFSSLSAMESDPLISKVAISQGYSRTPGVSFAVYNAAPPSKRHESVSPILYMKGKKNEVEIQGMINAHLKDAVALCDFFAFLENEMIAGNYWDELSASAKLVEYRSQQADYVGLSFETISASGPNAAVVHYIPTPKTNRQIDYTSTYLLDSGAQYKDGTTDITRTLHFGEPTSFQIEAYTRVLMGAMEFAMMVFPVGFTLNNIDIIARRPLYEVGLDYRHTTSHGIGMFLYVHESYRDEYEVGFFGSDEPGYYQDGEFGIRLETTLTAVVKETPHDFLSPMMGFDPVAFVPFEPKLINATLLSRQQCEALNRYHAKVKEVVGRELLNQGRCEGYHYVIRKTEPIVC